MEKSGRSGCSTPVGDTPAFRDQGYETSSISDVGYSDATPDSESELKCLKKELVQAQQQKAQWEERVILLECLIKTNQVLIEEKKKTEQITLQTRIKKSEADRMRLSQKCMITEKLVAHRDMEIEGLIMENEILRREVPGMYESSPRSVACENEDDNVEILIAENPSTIPLDIECNPIPSTPYEESTEVQSRREPHRDPIVNGIGIVEVNSTPQEASNSPYVEDNTAGTAPPDQQAATTPPDQQAGPSSSNQHVGASSSNQQAGASSSNQQAGTSSLDPQGGASSSNQQAGTSSLDQQGGASSSNQQAGASSSNQQAGTSSLDQQAGTTPPAIHPNVHNERDIPPGEAKKQRLMNITDKLSAAREDGSSSLRCNQRQGHLRRKKKELYGAEKRKVGTKSGPRRISSSSQSGNSRSLEDTESDQLTLSDTSEDEELTPRESKPKKFIRVRKGIHYAYLVSWKFFNIDWCKYIKGRGNRSTCQKCNKCGPYLKIVDHLWSYHFRKGFYCPHCPPGSPPLSERGKLSRHCYLKHPKLYRSEDFRKLIDTSRSKSLEDYKREWPNKRKGQACIHYH